MTVTEFYCGPTSSGQPPIISIPETSLVTDTTTFSPVPGTESTPCGEPSSEPIGVEPTASEPTSAAPTSDEQTTVVQTVTSTPDPSTSEDSTEAPTESSSSPEEPPVTDGSTSQARMNNFGLVVALTFALLV